MAHDAPRSSVASTIATKILPFPIRSVSMRVSVSREMNFPFPLHLPGPAGLYSRSIDICFRWEYFLRRMV